MTIRHGELCHVKNYAYPCKGEWSINGSVISVDINKLEVVEVCEEAHWNYYRCRVYGSPVSTPIYVLIYEEHLVPTAQMVV